MKTKWKPNENHGFHQIDLYKKIYYEGCLKKRNYFQILSKNSAEGL